MKTTFVSLLSILIFYLLSSPMVNSATIVEGFFYYSESDSIAPGKSGLESGVAASSDNFTNNEKGITGIKMRFYLVSGETLESLSLGDFDFHFGNINNAGSWDQLSLSNTSISTMSNEAIITWDSPIAQDGWLEVEYLTDQYLYFGNLVGDASSDGFLTPYDANIVINYLNSGNSEYSYQYDINGDGDNSPFDALAIINLLNSGGSGTFLEDGPFTQTSSGPPGPIRLPIDPILFPYHNITFDLAYSSSDGTYALVANPVPEPATIILLSSGLGSLLVFRRKYRRK